MNPWRGFSRDRELFNQLKGRFGWYRYRDHDWEVQYNGEGRLLRLNLNRLKLAQLPPELWQFTSLQRLGLNSNQLGSLPTELGLLTNLQFLEVYDNQLSSLPAELGRLTGLEILYLSSNQLSSLPAKLGQLTNLQRLGLSNNRLSTLPAELGQLTNLQDLSLSSNQLSSLPAELFQLTNLRTLSLGNNRLSSLPAELGQLTNLHTLDLGNNQLSSLPAELGQLTNLQDLDLSQNPQLQIPPPEVVGQGTPSVLAYLRALQADETSIEKSSANTKETVPLKIFYCYAHEDKDLRDRIDKHLGVLKRLGHVVGWYDREIQAGTEWEREIEGNLSTANIILLLVSADFVASDYCYGVEMTKALELHRTGQARVLPILLRPVDWQDAPFATLQMLPTGAKSIMQWKDQDEALEDVAKGIRNIVSSLRSQKK